MYTSSTYPNRVLPQQALDILTQIEEEIERPILLIASRLLSGRLRARPLIADAWARIESVSGPVDQAVKDSAVALVVGCTETGGTFRYRDSFPTECFIEGTDFNMVSRYYPGGEYVNVNDENGETHSIGAWTNYADLHENLVCLGFTYSQNWEADTVAALDWNMIVGDLVRMVSVPDFAESAAERRRTRDEQAFGAYMMNNRGSALTQARARLNEFEGYITSYTEQMASYMTRARTTALEIAGIEARLAGQDDEAAWRQKWNAVVNHAKVTEVRLQGGTLVITTEDLFMEHPRTAETRWLGRFDIRIDASSGVVRMNNLDNAKGGRDHPHVPGGAPCWGNAASMVSSLMSQGELYALLDLCIMFLSTFNLADDWGVYGAYWFDAPDETPDRLKPPEELVEQIVEAVSEADLEMAVA